MIPVRSLTAAVHAGANFIALTNRRGLAVDDVLRVGTPNNEEYVTVRRLPNRAAAGPDPGNVIFAPPLTRDYPQVGTPVVRQNPVSVANVQPSVLVLMRRKAPTPFWCRTGGAGPEHMQRTRFSVSLPRMTRLSTTGSAQPPRMH